MAHRNATVEVSPETTLEGEHLRHDLLAGVHTLLGALELLLTTKLNARQRRYVTVCQRTAENLTTLSRTVAIPEEGSMQRLAIDELAGLGVAYLPKPVSRALLLEAIKGVNDRRPLRMLAADDSPHSRALIDEFLKRTAKRLDIVNDGLDALNRYKRGRGRYDLLIIDLDMPVMDGRTAIRAIRDWEAAHGTHRVPIIVLTAHDLITTSSWLAARRRRRGSTRGVSASLGPRSSADPTIPSRLRIGHSPSY